MKYDVIVIGGSFSGLSSAYFLSKAGLNVCVVERGKIGGHTKTTGIIEEAIYQDIKIPSSLTGNDIKGINIYSPLLQEYSFPFKKVKLRQSKTLELLKWFKGLCLENNVNFVENRNCKNIKITKDCAKCESLTGEVIVFATGILPRLKFLPKNNFRYYAGLEYLANWKGIKDVLYWQVYFDLQIAPGYFSWIAPINKKTAHIGILKNMDDKIPINVAASNFFAKLHLKPSNILETRSGLVPIRGSIERTYGNRFLIVGDAAGHLGQLFSGGIHYGIRAGKIIGNVLPTLIDSPSKSNLKLYEVQWKKEMGKMLREESFLRSLFDKIKTNEQLEEVLSLLDDVDKNILDEVFSRFSLMKEINLQNLLLPYAGKVFNLVKSFI